MSVRPVLRPPRLGVTGSAGTGKTTLAALLADDLGLPLAAEAMRGRLADGLDLHRLDRNDHRAMIRGDALDLTGRLVQAERDGLVTDRTPLDMLAFWLLAGFAWDAADETEALAQTAICAMAGYDAVLLLPWGVLPLEADGIRAANPWHQLAFQGLITDLCRRWIDPSRLLILPEQPMSAPERRQWVRARLTRV